MPPKGDNKNTNNIKVDNGFSIGTSTGETSTKVKINEVSATPTETSIIPKSSDIVSDNSAGVSKILVIAFAGLVFLGGLILILLIRKKI